MPCFMSIRSKIKYALGQTDPYKRNLHVPQFPYHEATRGIFKSHLISENSGGSINSQSRDANISYADNPSGKGILKFMYDNALFLPQF